MNRGLLVLLAVLFALPLGGASAGAPAPARGPLVEFVALLDGAPLAERPGNRAGLQRQQAGVAADVEAAIPGARIRWRYQVVLNGLAVVAPKSAAARLAAIPGVREVQQSVRYHHALFRSPQVIGAPQLWGPTLATAGSGIKIGVIDDGVDQAHPFFSPAGFTMPAGFPKGNRAYTTAKVIVARAFPPPGANWPFAKVPFDPTESEHGTHVAGIAAGDFDTAATDENGSRVNVSGIAPRAYLGNYRIGTIPTDGFGLDGNSPEIAAAIEQAVKDGMNVINLSYGEPEITPSRDIVVQAMNAAADAGVVPVIAAGNDFDSVGAGSISSPASAQKAIAVAAASKSSVIAAFSSGGPAPISLRLKPDVTAPGVSILSSVPPREGTWTTLDGTSMASPHVAGAAAVLKQRHPGWTVAQIKSALVSTGTPVSGGGKREVPPTREGGGMIWLPGADQPLLFAAPTSLSFGLLRRGRSLSLGMTLSDAGGGAGSWKVAVRQVATARGVRFTTPATVTVPGRVTLRATVSGSAPADEGSGFVVLTHAGVTRRFPYWLRVTVPRLATERQILLRRPGTYRGDTRGRPSRVSSYRYPAAPGPLGVLERLRGPEQVFRFVIRGRVANAGAVVTSQTPGSLVSPRLVQGASEDRLTGYPGLPLRINPYEPNFFGLEPAVGVFHPAPGSYDLVFDTVRRSRAGRFTFRFWVNDTTPPAVRLLTRATSAGRLSVRVTDRGSGVDPSSLVALVDGKPRRIVWSPSTGVAEVGLGNAARGKHRLTFSASDYQETKNNENAASVLPNTRSYSAAFSVR
ncbi:MAG TPA: S8 family serine peptidase [Gaiellaceae bacterium]